MIKLLDYHTSKRALRTPGRKVFIEETASSEFLENIEKMKEVLAADGVGLAATQVGWPLQLFMLCIDEKDSRIEPRIFLNPEILSYSKKQIKMEEGCLSFKGLYLPIIRPATIKWKYETVDGKIFVEEVEGFYARAVQHETDHCQGRVFIDRASAAQKIKIKKWSRSA